jgi:K+ transporter
MKLWLTIWIGFALVTMAWSEWHNPLYGELGLTWMGAAYLTLHHFIAIGTADFFASWFMLLVPPLLLWYAGAGIIAVARRARRRT